jgi:hypothetical protein
MSLKITDTAGFKIGNVLNPSITEIYIRVLPNLQKENKLSETEIEVNSEAKTTVLGGRFDESIQVNGISPLYWLKYDSDVVDMNAKYLELEEDLKAILEANNPTWTIVIENLGV